MGTVFGWIGSICFALCGIPQATQCVKQGHAKGLSPIFLGLWLTGEICYVTAVLMEFGFVVWMMMNYICNITCIFVILRYHRFPRNRTNK